MKNIEITKEPVKLYKILKFEGVVSSGGEAKAEIDNGQVMVNGEIETRRRKKIIGLEGFGLKIKKQIIIK